MVEQASSGEPAWPTLDPGRLAAAARILAETFADPAVRAQLYSLATAVDCLGAQGEASADPLQLRSALEAALAADDERAIIAAARKLARHDRSLIPAVDWSAVSGA